MKKIKAIALASTVALVSACSTTYSPQVPEADFSKAASFKKGEACATSVLFFGPFGSSSVVKAAGSADLKTVHVVEKEFSSYLLFSKDCTVVYGV